MVDKLVQVILLACMLNMGLDISNRTKGMKAWSWYKYRYAALLWIYDSHRSKGCFTLVKKKGCFTLQLLGFSRTTKVMFSNKFCFLFLKTCFWEYKKIKNKTIFLYFLNKKTCLVIWNLKRLFFEEKNRKY